MDVPPCQAPTPALTRLGMENLPWATAGGDRGATRSRAGKPRRRRTGDCRPRFQLCPGQWGRIGAKLQDLPQRVLYLPLAQPSSFLLLKSTGQTVRAERATETAAAQSPRQAPVPTQSLEQLHLGHRTKPPQGQFCAVPATSAGPEQGQQGCPCKAPTLQQCQGSATATLLPRAVPWHDGAAGAAQPPRIPCRHRRNTAEPSMITTALGQALDQRDSQGALGPSSPPAQPILLTEQAPGAVPGRDREEQPPELRLQPPTNKCRDTFGSQGWLLPRLPRQKLP